METSINSIRPHLSNYPKIAEKKKSIVKIKNNNNTKLISYLNNYYLPVSFSSKKIKENKSNVENATEFGCKIFENMMKNNGNFNTKEFLQKNIHTAAIKDMSNYSLSDNSYGAVMLYRLGQNFKPKNTIIYIPEDMQYYTHPAECLCDAAAIAHEYTHLLQVDEDCRFYKKLSNNNYEYAATVMGVGGGIFRLFDEIHANIGENYQELDKPGIINDIFDNLYTETVYDILANPFESDLNIVLEPTMRGKDSAKKFKEDVKQCCIRQAEKEIEAYSTTIAVYQKYCNSNVDPDIQSTQSFYELIKKRLQTDKTD